MPTVVLRHTLPDSSVHYDWMIQWPRLNAEHSLLTFRCDTRPDQAAPESTDIVLERLPNHRSIYLAYEGPISGDRGSVQRVASGTCVFSSPIPKDTESIDEIEFHIQWENETNTLAKYRICQHESGSWTLNISHI